MSHWEQTARYLLETYTGTWVDWKERYYICPECGEAIYECDWEENDFGDLCPVCFFGADE